MSDTQLNPSTDVAAVRSAMFDDLAEVDVFAEAIGKSTRTIQRLIAQKAIPTVTIGRTPYVVVSRAREVMMSGLVLGHDPVRRGRPAGRKAA